MRAVIESALKRPPGEVIVDARLAGLPVTSGDLETLVGLSWLNDNIMNEYLNLIVDRSRNEKHLPKVFAYNTFFLQVYTRMGYGDVRKWTRRDDIFAHDILFFPVHENEHWTMAMVDLRVKHIKYMDSMGGRNDECLAKLLTYLAQESKDKRNIQLNSNEWRLIHVDNLPKQRNCSDCGIFALKYAEFAARDAHMAFSQCDMPFFRKLAMYEILRSALV